MFSPRSYGAWCHRPMYGEKQWRIWLLGVRGEGGGGGAVGLEGGVPCQQGERCELANWGLWAPPYAFGGITRQATL